MKDEVRRKMFAILKEVADEQRHILHKRIIEVTKAATVSEESNRSDFIITVMNGLPYPDFDSLLITFFGDECKKLR